MSKIKFYRSSIGNYLEIDFEQFWMTSCEKQIKKKNGGRKSFYFCHFGWIFSAKNEKQKSEYLAYCARITFFGLKVVQRCQ